MVTGASGGLGAAICSELARHGAELVLTARRRELLVDLAARTGGEVVVADLADRLDVDRLTEDALGCDVLVLNAGVGNDGPLEEATADGADLVLDVNLRAPIQMSLAFVQHALAERRRAAVVTVGSLSGIVATPNTRMYNATKFGLRGFTLSLHQDLLGTPVHASLVAPGFIRDAKVIRLLTGADTALRLATQMAPEARGAAVTLFACVLFLTQSVGVWTIGLSLDRGALATSFSLCAGALVLLGWWVSRNVRPRA